MVDHVNHSLITDTRTRGKGRDEKESEGAAKTANGGTEIGKVPVHNRY